MTLETIIIIFCAIGLVGSGLYVRFAPDYINNRRKRYIQPPKRKTHPRRKEVE